MKNSSIVFSVVIPLFNKESEIANTIKSVLRQSFSCFEIIVVNDGSTDNSIGVLNTFNDNRIKLINKMNGGVSSARNRGIIEAKGLFVALLDADDIWLPNYLQEIKYLIDKFNTCNIYCTNYSISLNPINIDNEVPKQYIINNYFEVAMNMPLLTASSIVIRRERLVNNMLFNEIYTHGEDLDLWLRLYKINQSIGYSNKKLVIYNHIANNRATKIIPHPKKHFAFYINLNSIISKYEKLYYINQLSFLVWLYLKNLKLKYFFDILLKHKRYSINIVLRLFSNLIFMQYKNVGKRK